MKDEIMKGIVWMTTDGIDCTVGNCTVRRSSSSSRTMKRCSCAAASQT